MPDSKAMWRKRLRAGRRHAASDLGRREGDAQAYALAVPDLLRMAGGDTPVRRVAAYESGPSEPPTHRLIGALLARGVEVIVPVLREDLDLDWALAGPETAPGRPLRTTLAEPGPHLGVDAIGRCELVLVPALAVGRDGVRLGQGGGSYDRALRRAAPGALIVAVVFDDELLDAGVLPADPHDVPVHAALTPARLTFSAAGRGSGCPWSPP